MKAIIASDIHGSLYYAEKVVSLFESEKAEKLILLGDLLYHGPRNPLPKDYSPKDVFTLLNKYSSKILAIRGNCDSEVDQMVLSFPMMADYAIFEDGSTRLFLTHGHLFNKEVLPCLEKGDYLLNGHFHVPEFTNMGDFTYVNCGSTALPKDGTPHSCIVYENGSFRFVDLGE